MKYAILILAGTLMLAVTGELWAQSGDESEGVLGRFRPGDTLEDAIRNYTNLLLRMAKRRSDGSLVLFGPDDSPEEMAKRLGDNGADQDELELLKRAWGQHKEEKQEENPLGRNSETRRTLEDLLGLMKAVERRLTKEDSGSKTQELQEEILAILQDWIDSAKQPEDPRESPKKSQRGGSDKEPDSQPEEGPEKPGLVDPSRSAEPAKPGSARKQELLQKAGKGEKQLRYGPTGKKQDGWDPKLPGSSTQKELEEGANEKRPPQKEELIDRYFKELLKGRPGK